MDLSISVGPGGKAAAASTRAKRACLLACVVLAAGMYVSQERSRAAAEARLREAHPEVPALASRLAQQRGNPAAPAVHNVFYDGKDRVYCGEVGGKAAPGAEVRFRDGVRIFVCGPGVHD